MEFTTANILALNKDCLDQKRDLKRKEMVIEAVKNLFQECMEGILRQASNHGEPSYTILPFGSYSLGLSIKFSDVDLCAILPKGIKGKAFQETFEKALKNQENVTNLNIINASVPLLTFDYKELSFDVIAAEMPMTSFQESPPIKNFAKK
jgi:poly(A) polymerase Pap1